MSPRPRPLLTLVKDFRFRIGQQEDVAVSISPSSLASGLRTHFMDDTVVIKYSSVCLRCIHEHHEARCLC